MSRGPRFLIIKISYCAHYSAQNKWGKDTFLEGRQLRVFLQKVHSEVEGLEHWALWPSLAWLLLFFLCRDLMGAIPLHILLASPPPLPHALGDRGPGICACIPAGPRTGLPLCNSGSKTNLNWSPQGLLAIILRSRQFQLSLQLAGSVCVPPSDCWGLQSPTALLQVSWYSLVTNMMWSFPPTSPFLGQE